jgi:hypothetical protein
MAVLVRSQALHMNAFETLREQVPIGRLVECGKGGKARCVAPGHAETRRPCTSTTITFTVSPAIFTATL